MYIIKKLTTSIEFETYRRRFYEGSGLSPSSTKEIGLDYLGRSLVYGVFDEKDEMVAGYTLGITSPYRLLEFVPEKARLDLEKQFDLEQCCEVVCVWKIKSVSGRYTGRYLWPHILNNLLATRKKFLLGHNQSEKLDKYYRVLGPKTLYYGQSSYGLPSRLFVYGRAKIYLIKIYLFLFHSIVRAIKR